MIGRRRAGEINERHRASLSTGQAFPATVKELKDEGRIAILLEPASPYADRYSLAGITAPDQKNMIVEVVGPGFDASDILRGDLSAHERWQLDLELTARRQAHSSFPTGKRVYLTTSEKYAETVQARFAKIGAKIKDGSFRDALMKGPKTTSDELAKERIAFLRTTNQTALLKIATLRNEEST